jgi:hypothetical protein
MRICPARESPFRQGKGEARIAGETGDASAQSAGPDDIRLPVLLEAEARMWREPLIKNFMRNWG